MSDNEMPRRIIECKPGVLGGLDFDGKLEWRMTLRKLKVSNWWTVAKDRESWKKILQEAEAHKEL
jgi:hypothetical protein